MLSVLVMLKTIATSSACASILLRLPMLKKSVDFVTNGSRGAGVVELIDKLITLDLSEVDF
ncbi:MAG TPA: hypothetical protein V6C71_09005 [Coleofasciculaceae cyanobacterium]|jgi:hypothetical protein